MKKKDPSSATHTKAKQEFFKALAAYQIQRRQRHAPEMVDPKRPPPRIDPFEDSNGRDELANEKKNDLLSERRETVARSMKAWIYVPLSLKKNLNSRFWMSSQILSLWIHKIRFPRNCSPKTNDNRDMLEDFCRFDVFAFSCKFFKISSVKVSFWMILISGDNAISHLWLHRLLMILFSYFFVALAVIIKKISEQSKLVLPSFFFVRSHLRNSFFQNQIWILNLFY